jgi:hypothetical protein
LQELVRKFGSYSQITPEAWAQYDCELEQWKADLRHGRHEQADEPDEGAE